MRVKLQREAKRSGAGYKRYNSYNNAYSIYSKTLQFGETNCNSDCADKPMASPSAFETTVVHCHLKTKSNFF